MGRGGGTDSCRRLAELGEPTTESETPGAVARPRGSPQPTHSPTAGACPRARLHLEPRLLQATEATPTPSQLPLHGGQGRGLALPAWHPARKPHLQSGCNLPSQADGATVKVEGKNTLPPWTEREVPVNGGGGLNGGGPGFSGPPAPAPIGAILSPPRPAHLGKAGGQALQSLWGGGETRVTAKTCRHC